MSVYGVLDDVNVSVVGTTKVIDSHDVLPSNSKNVLSLEIQNAVFIKLNHFFKAFFLLSQWKGKSNNTIYNDTLGFYLECLQ